MMRPFYTNVVQRGNALIHFYVDQHGQRKRETIKYKPSLGIKVGKQTKCKDMFGQNIGMIDFDSISEMYKWRRDNDTFTDIYNDIEPKYQFLSDRYRYDIIPDYTKVKIFILDIECHSTEGFPKASQALYPVTAITIKDHYKNQFYTFGFKEDYKPKANNVTYFKCNDECDLLEKFILFFRKERPDIISGWYIDDFDIPYLINRIKRQLPEGMHHKLSPLNEVKERLYKNEFEFNIVGVTMADYLALYKNWSFTPQENYRLETVASAELGKGKLDYHDSFRNLSELYENDFETYIDYNIQDVELIPEMDKKRNFFEVFMMLTYMNKSLYEDSFATVKPWDVRLYNELKKRDIAIPPRPKNIQKEAFPGGYTQRPIPGLYRYVSVWDIVSSYPNQLISGNVSPETIVPSSQLPSGLKELQDKIRKINWMPENAEFAFIEIEELKKYKQLMQQEKVCVMANGEFFRTDIEGILPVVFKHDFDLRRKKKSNKKKVGQYIDANKNTLTEDELEKLQSKKSTLHVEQMALKIFLNSGYGALANVGSRYYNIKIASAITTTGQQCSKGAKKTITDAFPDIKNIYGDTDSIFLYMDKTIRDKFGDSDDRKEILKFIKEYMASNVEPVIKSYFADLANAFNLRRNTYVMEFEAVADRSIFASKKRYIMRLIHKDGVDQDLDKLPLKIRGIEVVRSNTPKTVRDKLKEAINVILDTDDNDASLDFIEKYKKEFFEMPFEQVARPTGVNGMTKYQLGQKSVPINVRASKIFNKALKHFKIEDEAQINEGDKILYAYIKEPNIFKSNVIACIDRMPKEILDAIEIDYQTQFQKTMKKPLDGIFEKLKWQTERVNKITDEWY